MNYRTLITLFLALLTMVSVITNIEKALAFYKKTPDISPDLVAVKFSIDGEEVDCDDYYFGVTVEPDFGKALQCYEANKFLEFEGRSWEFLILMHLNGEGTPVDVKKAEELFKAWENALPHEVTSMQADALREAIQERKRDPQKSYPRLEYCTDIAGDTVTLNFCSWIKERLAENDFETVMAITKAKLKGASKAIFDKVVAAFTLYQESESQRMYQQYIDGTIRRVAASEQASFVQEQFLSLVKETVEQRGITPADNRAYEAADNELNQVYQDDIRDYVKFYEKLIKNAELVQAHERYKRFIEGYKKAAKKAQIHWINYRDLWVELARSLNQKRTRTFDPIVSMQTALTKLRTVELRNDPVVGN